MTLGLAMPSRPLLAVGGAGVADSRDATAAALNPAGLVHVGTEASIAASLFSPHREIESPALGGTVESSSNYFVVPNLAASYRFAPNPFVDAVGFTVYGNGGMNTEYPGGASVAAGFGTGRLGIDLEQAFLSIAFAKTLAPGLSVGVAPILARQAIKIEGLQNFAFPAPFNASSDPDHVTNQGTDVSWGGGVRAGIEWALAPQLRIGVAGNSRIYMNEFEKYRGLFAEQGDFDIPASLQAGVAFDATPNLTFLADYKRIWFGSVKSIANPSTNPPPFGADNGPGFGWDDVDVVKLGVEWRTSPDLTLRAGYAYATNAIGARDAQLNIFAPAVVQHHITAGFEYLLRNNWSVEVAGLYAPEGSQSGYFYDTSGAVPVAYPLDLRMHQYEATVGFKYKWDDAPAPLK